MPPLIDLTGQRFGKLTARWPMYRGSNGVVWLVSCDCGNTHKCTSNHLRRGLISSCGCLRKTVPQVNSTFRHGHCGRKRESVEHKAWSHMISRCTNPNDNEWHRYGARGISVCSRWGNFENFLADVGPKPPSPNPHSFSIHRINNDGNYESGNVRWATAKEQCVNRRLRGSK